jgi:hypothetical protein
MAYNIFKWFILSSTPSTQRDQQPATTHWAQLRVTLTHSSLPYYFNKISINSSLVLSLYNLNINTYLFFQLLKLANYR